MTLITRCGLLTYCRAHQSGEAIAAAWKEHDALAHAKPILIQGAWLAASAPGGGGAAAWRQYAPAMEALLGFWERPPRREPRTQLRPWHDQMESGADNGVLSACPSARSACWTPAQAYTLASADLMVYLQRARAAGS